MADRGEDLVTLYDGAPLNARYWTTMALAIASSVFDYFDYFVVGFLVAVLAPQWQLTFGQTSIMLLSAGVGAIIGSLMWGALADRFGRKRLLVAGIALCALGAGSVSLIADGAWIMFAGLRFVVGFGVGAAASAAVPLIVEYTPTRHRTIITSATVIPVSLGVLTASLTAATMLQSIGWRGLAALGFIPLIPAVLIALIAPESVRWLVSRGRNAEARRIVARALKTSAEKLPHTGGVAANVGQETSFADLLRQPKLFWLTVIVWFGASTANYGVFLWGPTIVALLMGVPPQQAAHLFIFVSLTGMIGRTAFSILPQWIGRRRCGAIMGYGIAVSLGAAPPVLRPYAVRLSCLCRAVDSGRLVLRRRLLQHRAVLRGNIPGEARRARRGPRPGRQRHRQNRRSPVPRADRGRNQPDHAEGNGRRGNAGLPVPRGLWPRGWSFVHAARRRNPRQAAGAREGRDARA